MLSNIELLLETVRTKKSGFTQQTINELVVQHGRNRRHLVECFRILEQQGIVKLSINSWTFIKK